MTQVEAVMAGTLIAIAGFYAQTFSHRHDDTFVRRLSAVLWLALGLLVAGTCAWLYERWQSVFLIVVTSSALTSLGGEAGIMFATWLKNLRQDAIRRRGRKRAKRAQDDG